MTLRCSNCNNIWRVEPHAERKCPLCSHEGKRVKYKKLAAKREWSEGNPARQSGYGCVLNNADHSGGKVVVHRNRFT